jgi:hypothetical protein
MVLTSPTSIFGSVLIVSSIATLAINVLAVVFYLRRKLSPLYVLVGNAVSFAVWAIFLAVTPFTVGLDYYSLTGYAVLM